MTNSLNDDITFAALLTPQGKIIADVFIHKIGENHFVLETAQKFARALTMRLKMYKLRAKIDIIDESDAYKVYAFWNGSGDIGLSDPRHPALGHRLLSPILLNPIDTLSPDHTPDDYDLHRLALGVPDSMWDFDSEQMFPADVNMDLLHGVDYKKGCFIGQEVVSRMHRKTEVRKRMRAIKLSAGAQVGDALKAGGRTVGTLNHVRNNLGMALVRLDRLASSDDDVLVNDHPAQVLEPSYDPQS